MLEKVLSKLQGSLKNLDHLDASDPNVLKKTSKLASSYNFFIEVSVGNKKKTKQMIEWIEQGCSFNGEDLLILNNNELEVAGFNFISLQDLLDYVYEFSEYEQISIFRQQGYFSENLTKSQNIELIWKGIMLK